MHSDKPKAGPSEGLRGTPLKEEVDVQVTRESAQQGVTEDEDERRRERMARHYARRTAWGWIGVGCLVIWGLVILVVARAL